jgi:hypothetical protein
LAQRQNTDIYWTIFMPTFLKRHPFIGLVFIIGIPILTIYLISFLCAKSGFLYNFPIPIQDCMMTKTTLKGAVIDIRGKSISNVEIYFENTPVDNSTPVKRTISSDENGHFGPESIHFFKCEPINFTIRAAGFHEKTISYILELLPSELKITLERSS